MPTKTPFSVQCDPPSETDVDVAGTANQLDLRLKRQFPGSGVIRRQTKKKRPIIGAQPICIEPDGSIWLDSGDNDAITRDDLAQVAEEFGFRPRQPKPAHCAHSQN